MQFLSMVQMSASELRFSIVVASWIFFSLLVGSRAPKYHRSPGAWLLLSLIFSPLTAFVFLNVAGISYNAVVRKTKEQRLGAEHPELAGIAKELVLYETNCPACHAQVNPATGDGIAPAPEDEPWRLACASCGAEIS